MRPMAVVAVFVAGAIAAACAGDGGGGDGGDGGVATTVNPSAPTSSDDIDQLGGSSLETPDPGGARVALGSSLRATLALSSCHIDPGAAPVGGAPAELATIDATGETDDGTPVHLAIRRFRSEAEATTITDTATLATGTPDSPTAAWVAQRFEVGGEVTDPRDPGADDPLVRVSGQEVRVEGVFAPPGAFAGDGELVEGAVVAVCRS